MKKIGIGVIGAGFMGSMHAKIFNNLPNVNLVGIADLNTAKSKELAESLGIKAFKDYHAMLKEKEIEAVSICVSDNNHLKPTVDACKAGKHILLEKPIASDLEEAETIVKEAKKNKVRLTVGHLLRLDPRYYSLRKNVDSGKIGYPLSIFTQRNSPITDGPARYGSKGNLTLHVAVHDVDLILWVMQKKIRRIYAEHVSIALKKLNIEDAIFVTLKFEDGSIGSMHYNWALPKSFPTHIDAKMQVIGTKGYASVDFAEQGLTICGEEGYQWPDVIHWPEINGIIKGDLHEELVSFVDALVNKKEFIITADESFEAVKIALAINESLKKEKVINL